MDIEKICAECGIKLTQQRKIIARIIYEAEDHPHAE